jgi:hypothetical protein
MSTDILFSRPNTASAHFQLLRRNIAEALFSQKLRNGRYVCLHMDLHRYLVDSVLILGSHTVEDLPISQFGIQLQQTDPRSQLSEA